MRVEHRPHQRRARARHAADKDQRHVPMVRVHLLIAAHHEFIVASHLAGGGQRRRLAVAKRAAGRELRVLDEQHGGGEYAERTDDGRPPVADHHSHLVCARARVGCSRCVMRAEKLTVCTLCVFLSFCSLFLSLSGARGSVAIGVVLREGRWFNWVVCVLACV